MEYLTYIKPLLMMSLRRGSCKQKQRPGQAPAGRRDPPHLDRIITTVSSGLLLPIHRLD